MYAIYYSKKRLQVHHQTMDITLFTLLIMAHYSMEGDVGAKIDLTLTAEWFITERSNSVILMSFSLLLI